MCSALIPLSIRCMIIIKTLSTNIKLQYKIIPNLMINYCCLKDRNDPSLKQRIQILLKKKPHLERYA